MLTRLSLQLIIAVLITFLLIGIAPGNFYLRTEQLSIDWLSVFIFIGTLWAAQIICFRLFHRFSFYKRWGLSLLVALPAGIFAALFLYSLIFSLLWASEL
ncbi:MAG TPA: hypothetical protein VL092_03640 [Chitinophagaceae bacterium]|nr:hypothetical protein [Chitinophagaceae bacterium]